MVNINDEQKWTAFVKKLIKKTEAGEIHWYSESRAKRDAMLGPIFMAEILPGKYAAIYRYGYRYYNDEDDFTDREDVSIELVDCDGTKLWQLPAVSPRSTLMDLVDYNEAKADDVLKDFLDEDLEKDN